ncbi:MAG: hypothetical protein ACOYL5_08030 [Phototrophicaceae bacterium]
MLLKRALYTLFTLTLLIMPVAITSGLLAWQHNGATLLDFTPINVDEVLYWQQGASATAFPLSSGYYTNLEKPADISLLGRYQMWGPFLMQYYALFGRVIGWDYWAIPLINLISFTAVLALTVWLTRPSLEGLILLNIVILTFIPLWLYTPTGLTETLHQASAVAIAAGLVVLMRQPRRRTKIAVLVLLLAVTLGLRVTWGILLFPLVILWGQPTGRQRALWLGIATVGLLALYGLRSSLWTSFPEQFNQRVRVKFSESFQSGITFWWEHITYNLNGMRWDPLTNQAFYIQLGALAGLLCLAALVIWLLRHRPNAEGRIGSGEIAFHLFNLAVITAVIVVFYDVFDWRGYRTIAPHLLLTLVMLALMRRRWLVLAMIPFTVWVMPNALSAVYNDYYWTGYGHFTPSVREGITENVRLLAEHIQPQVNPPSAWCNSIALSQLDMQRVLAIPHGIGLNLIYGDLDNWMAPPPYTFKSRYLWLSPEVIARYQADAQAEYLGHIGGTPLYRNLTVDC